MRYNFQVIDFDGDYTNGQDCPIARIIKREKLFDGIKWVVGPMGVIEKRTGDGRFTVIGRARNTILNDTPLYRITSDKSFNSFVYEEIQTIILNGEFKSASVEIEIL